MQGKWTGPKKITIKDHNKNSQNPPICLQPNTWAHHNLQFKPRHLIKAVRRPRDRPKNQYKMRLTITNYNTNPLP